MRNIAIITIGFFFISNNCLAGWSLQTPNPSAEVRTRSTGFVIGDVVYIGTGYSGTAGMLKDFWKFESGVWTQLQDYPTARQSAIGFSIGNDGYIGTGSNGFVGGILNDFWKYDTTMNTWTQVTSMPGPRVSAVAFTIDGKAYAGGGTATSFLQDFYVFDTSSGPTGSWSAIADLPISISGSVGFSIGQLGYVCTGDNGTYRSDFFEYDPALDVWDSLPPFPGTPREGACGFSIGSKGYVGAGFDGLNLKTDFYEFYNGSWTPITDISNAMVSGFSGSTCSAGYVGYGNNTSTLLKYTPNISPSAGFVASKSNVCIGSCISFTDTSTNAATSWLWRFPNGDSSVVQNPANICFLIAGIDSVFLTTSKFGLCESTTANLLSVNDPEDFNMCTMDTCDTTTGIVYNTPLDIDDFNACTIDYCDSISGIVSHLINPLIDDGDSCTLDFCDSISGLITHTYLPIINLGNDTSLVDSSIVLHAGTGYTSYYWYPGGETADSLVVVASGTYIVEVTNNACTNSDTIEILFTTQIENHPIEIPFIVHPNPATDYINIKLNENIGSGRLLLYSMNGEVLYERRVLYSKELRSIDLDIKLNQGTYFLIYYSDKSLYYRNKVIVQ